MKINIKNIGIIKDSTINLNGITIVTGNNNSGKTTLGKTLYSIINAVENLEENAFQDQYNFVMDGVYNYIEDLGLFQVYRVANLNENTNSFIDYPILSKLLKREQISVQNLEQLICFIDDLCYEIHTLNIDAFSHLRRTSLAFKRIEERWNRLQENKERVEEQLMKLKKTISSDEKLIGYANAKIIKCLNIMFNSQISPVKLDDNIVSQIKVFDENTVYYDIEIKNKALLGNNEKFHLPAFDKCWFINDVDIVDELATFYDWNNRNRRYSRRYIRHDDDVSFKSFSNTIGMLTHRGYLLEGLTKQLSAYEENVFNQQAEEVLGIISKIFTDDVEIIDGKYVCSSDKLDVKNLASGSKLFLIVKLLLKKGCLTDRTMLILDEPENHLHPAWINRLSEALVLINKIIGCTIIITTHSPNFLLAMEVMAKRHGMLESESIYVSEKLEDNYLVQFKNCSENIEYAFTHLARPYLEMDALREKLETDDGSEE